MYATIVFLLYVGITMILCYLILKCEFVQIILWHVYNKLMLRDEDKLTYDEYKRVFKDEQKELKAIKKRKAKKKGRKIIHDERRKKTAKRYRNSVERQKYADRN